MRCIIRGTALLGTIPSRGAALGAWNAERGLPRQSNDCSPGVLDLLLCLLCGSSVIMPTVVVFLAHILHVTHQLSVLIQPFMPRLAWFIQRTWHIVPLPDALVLLRQSFPGREIPVRQLTSKRGGIPE